MTPEIAFTKLDFPQILAPIIFEQFENLIPSPGQLFGFLPYTYPSILFPFKKIKFIIENDYHYHVYYY